MKSTTDADDDMTIRRTPHGVRGLKFRMIVAWCLTAVSHPSRGAWIEIFSSASSRALTSGRTPHGVRGLKSLGVVDAALLLASHPSRGAWIEINTTSARTCAGTSHPSRGAWIEIDKD